MTVYCTEQLITPATQRMTLAQVKLINNAIYIVHLKQEALSSIVNLHCKLSYLIEETST